MKSNDIIKKKPIKSIYNFMGITGTVLLSLSLTILMSKAHILLGIFTLGAILLLIAAIGSDIEEIENKYK